MPATKTVLSFGLVAIPISMHPATQAADVGFHQLHSTDQSRIRYKKVCEGCGREIKQSDIVKGYEFEKDRYVVVTDEELEAIKTEKEKTIQLLAFVDYGQVPAVCFERAWHALPEAGGEKAFELLRMALETEGKIAVGKTVLGSREALMAVLPQEDGLMLESMYFADELRPVPRAYAKAKVAAQELEMARTLVRSMDVPFDLADYRDEYQAKLRQLFESKISGKEIAAPRKSAPGNVINLMDALKKSVEQAGKGGAKPKAKSAAANRSRRSA